MLLRVLWFRYSLLYGHRKPHEEVQSQMSNLELKSYWNDALAALLEDAPLQSVWDYVFDVFRSELNVSSLSVIEYFGDTMPAVLYYKADDDRDGRRIEAYQNGAYLLDPFFRATLDGPRNGCFTLKDCAPDGFEGGEYYNRFFNAYGMTDEINAFYAQSGGEHIALSVGREAGAEKFGNRTLAVLDTAEPFLSAIALRAATSEAKNSDPIDRSLRATFHSRLKIALEALGTSILTPREKTILDYLLNGYSVKAAAERLGVSEGTVRIHRHAIYSKLDIGSQTELFALVIESLKGLAPGNVDDPLKPLLPPPYP